MAKLHYDKEKLQEDYRNVFALALKGMAIFFVVVLIYFIIFMVGLGDKGHTPHGEFYDQFTDPNSQFGTRIEIEYEGKKLPQYPQEAE